MIFKTPKREIDDILSQHFKIKWNWFPIACHIGKIYRKDGRYYMGRIVISTLGNTIFVKDESIGEELEDVLKETHHLHQVEINLE